MRSKRKVLIKKQLPKGNLYKKAMETTLKNIRLRKQGKIDVLEKGYSKLSMNLFYKPLISKGITPTQFYVTIKIKLKFDFF